MKAKKPLSLALLVMALLAVALILPSAAAGWSDAAVNWVKGNYNSNNDFPDFQNGFTIRVQQGSELTDVEGFVIQKLMYTSNPAFALCPEERRATEFSPEGWDEDPYWYYVWTGFFGLDPDYALYYARFYDIDDDPVYPWPGLEEPSNADDIVNANIADFVVYLDAGFLADYYGLPPQIHWTTYPHRYVIVDFDDPDKEDLVQIYGLNLFVGGWITQLGQSAGLDAELLPVRATCFEVHVGESAL
jgi:hypothetical protein